RGAATVEDAAEVGVEHLAPVVEAHVGDAAELADAGVVDEDVHAAETADGFVDEPLRLGRLADVGAEREDAGAAAQGPDGFLQLGVVPRADRDLHAALKKRPRDRQPDPFRTARDNADHPVSIIHEGGTWTARGG